MKTKSIASTEAQNNFGRVLTDITINHTRYVIRRHDSPQVIMLSLKDFELLLVDQGEQKKMKNLLQELAPTYKLGEIVSEES